MRFRKIFLCAVQFLPDQTNLKLYIGIKISKIFISPSIIMLLLVFLKMFKTFPANIKLYMGIKLSKNNLTLHKMIILFIPIDLISYRSIEIAKINTSPTNIYLMQEYIYNEKISE